VTEKKCWGKRGGKKNDGLPARKNLSFYRETKGIEGGAGRETIHRALYASSMTGNGRRKD